MHKIILPTIDYFLFYLDYRILYIIGVGMCHMEIYNRDIIEKQPRPVTGEIYNYI